MKNSLLMLVTVLLVISSCQKDATDQPNYFKNKNSDSKYGTWEINRGSMQSYAEDHFVLSLISDATEDQYKTELRFNLYNSVNDVSGTYSYSESGEPNTFTCSMITYISSFTGSTIITGTSTSELESGTVTINLSNNIYEISFEVDIFIGYFKDSLD